MDDQCRRYALFFAGKGIYITPAHSPLFGHPRGWTCTCERWRHSDQCRATRPDIFLADDRHCDRAGKHSRGVKSWAAESTTDRAVVAAWWLAYPGANILVDCGKSGLLVLDLDKAKPNYDDSIEDALSTEDRDTVTVLTPSGGLHLWYTTEGETWPSRVGAAGGVDVKSFGGYVIAPPSLHKSGGRYRFEDGYGLTQVPLRPVPESVKALLAQPARRAGDADPVHVDQSSTAVRMVLDALSINFQETDWRSHEGVGVLFRLETCPFDPHNNAYEAAHGKHGRWAAYITVKPDGFTWAGCHHARCKEAQGANPWATIRSQVDWRRAALRSLRNG